MNRYFIFALLAVSLFVSLGFYSGAEARRNQTAFVNPTPTPSAKIEKAALDRDEIFIPCPPGVKRNEKCDEAFSIKVEISAVNPRNAELLYHYTVSGGRILGKGASVSWDLSGVRPGTYTITAGIDEGRGIEAETLTKTVQVKQCYCPIVDACPVIEISTPADSVKAGETITFTANLSGDFGPDMTYNWTVSAGEIVEGQGTPKIKVKTTREMAGGNLTASVEISSERVAGICERTASGSVAISK